ncbi:MAG: LruC domain-containing protein [Saprospiraceae bacterium]
MSALVVPSGFKFSTIHNLYLKIGAVDNYQKALKGIPVKIYQLETEDLARDYLSTVWIGEHGVVELPLQLATATQFLVFETDYPGIPSQTIALAPEMESLQIVLGEDNQAKDRSDHALYNPNGLGGIRDRNNTYTYMGSFDQDGVPNYLIPLGESVGQDVLELISANLPEGKSVRNHPAGLLDPAAQNNVVLQQAAEVRVHFIHEGSSMRSALGSAPYNPFLIAHGDRGVEIHLPLHPPTDLAQFSLFGTLDDDSIKTRWEIWLRTKFINVITIPEKNILRTQY